MKHFITQFCTILLVGAFGFSCIAIVVCLVTLDLSMYTTLIHSPEYCALGIIMALITMVLFVSTLPEKNRN
jgi:hypothetical protein